jgi:probable F420-dependent oxidoreductase
MEFGCHLPTFGPIATRGNLIAFARRMEALGYDSLWVSDHVIIPYAILSRYPYSETGQFPLPASANFLEPLTTLALVAGVTERIKLGTSILVLPHRHPVLTAKTLSSLDHLSGGRMILGVGVGWMEEEITILGGPVAKRGAWSDEAIRIMKGCWSRERMSYKGRFFSFDEIGCFPQPVRKAIPIWIGGHTPRAFQRVVELGDGWHAAFASLPQMEDSLRRLQESCRLAGRRFHDLAITVRAGLSFRKEPATARRPLIGTLEEIVDDLKGYRALGVQGVLLETRQRDLEDMVGIYETFAREIRPKL